MRKANKASQIVLYHQHKHICLPLVDDDIQEQRRLVEIEVHHKEHSSDALRDLQGLHSFFGTFVAYEHRLLTREESARSQSSVAGSTISSAYTYASYLLTRGMGVCTQTYIDTNHPRGVVAEQLYEKTVHISNEGEIAGVTIHALPYKQTWSRIEEKNHGMLEGGNRHGSQTGC